MIRETVGHLRDLPRYRQILTTLMRYGYQDVVAALHLEGLVRPIERAALGDGVPPQDRACRLRMVLEDLGPTFVKLGQLLAPGRTCCPSRTSTSSRPCARRPAVRDSTRSRRSWARSTAGRRPRSSRPWTRRRSPRRRSRRSTARSCTTAGRVALKVRRPDIVKVVRADLDITKNLAQLVERHIPVLAPYRPVELAREFERVLRRELD